MAFDGGSPTDLPARRVLFVGPPEWQSSVEAVTDQVDGVRADTVQTAAQAHQAIDKGSPVACVVCAERLEDGSGLKLAGHRTVRDAGCPFVLAPRRAESVTDVDLQQVSWVVPLDATGPGITGIDGLSAVLSRELEFHSRDRTATQFRAVFDDPDRFVAVLDSDGTVRSLNDAAQAFLAGWSAELTGKRFWALPWADGRSSRRDAQRAVGRAADGTYDTFEAELATGNPDGDDGVRLEFRVQPTGDGGRDGVLVQGEVLTEREQLEEELRSSEELHRVTLNNMTDTVLVTNDAGEFTYVCPNVHFIFGYTAEEIYELGTIDELLGEDPFDEDRLAAEGVVTNVECRATDKDGDEHTLLVNVRNVSIQDGTRLVSCRDVTKRKQRERALTQLQRTSRELLYAETKTDVSNHVAEEATKALTSGGVALFKFDGEENVLYPIAASDPLWDALGSLPDISLDQRSQISRAFVEEVTTSSTDAGRESVRPLLTNLSDYTAIPLGEHGVMVVGTFDAEIEGVNEEVGELLAATTEAAFDRIERESELRERDETLQRQNRWLSELNQINEIIRDVDRAVVHAESRTEIERAVCDRLTADGRFSFAWIGETTARDQRVRPRDWAGDDGGYLDGVSLSLTGEESAQEPALQTVLDGEMTVVPNVADRLRDGEWGKAAVSRNFNSVLSIPLVYDEVLLGTLTVYDDEPNSFGETVREVFSELGETIGAAINGIQRKEALSSDSVYRLAYRITDPSSVLLRTATEHGCTLAVESEVVRSDEATTVFVTVSDAKAKAVAESLSDLVDVTAAEVIRTAEDGGLVRFEVRNPFVSSALANHGATRRTLEATPDGIQLVVDVPDAATIRTVDEMLSSRFTDVELLSQQKQTRPTDAPSEPDSLLTDRQQEVAQVAFHSGFFDSDRSVTGRDVAEMLDISHTAFYDHVRRVEQKLFAALLEQRDQYITVE